jgi:hypothetical protein
MKDFEPTQKQLKDLKTGLEQQHGREFSDEEVRQAVWSLKRLAEIVLDGYKEESERQKLLKEKPKGFHLKKGGTCRVGGEYAPEENSWFDQNGVKCLHCQRAIDEKVIPASIIEKKDSWYSTYDLEKFFNIKGADLNKYIKNGLLKERIIKNDKKKSHFQLFLMKDNKDVLPPKSLLKSRSITVIHNEEEYLTDEPWFETADEKVVKRLAKFQIIECLKETLQKPITTGRFLIPKNGINPLFTRK